MLAGSVGVAGASSTYDMRGEWTFNATCACTLDGQHGGSGTALIQTMEANGEFSGTATLAGFAGTISGAVTGTEQLSALLNFPFTPEGAVTFTLAAGTLDATSNAFSGAGVWKDSKESAEGHITAKRIRTLEQIEREAKEAKERREKEQKENEQKEKELKEKRELQEKEEAEKRAKEAEEAKEREAKEKEAQAKQHEKEALEQKARAENEAKESAEREAKARAEREAKEREAKEQEAKRIAAGGGTGASGPATLAAKTFTVGALGSLSLKLSNPNVNTISGEIVLAAASAGKAGHGSVKGRSTVLARVSYTISAYATKAVGLRLSKSALAELRHRKRLQALATITTRANGGAPLTKTYSITLTLTHTKHG